MALRLPCPLPPLSVPFDLLFRRNLSSVPRIPTPRRTPCLAAVAEDASPALVRAGADEDDDAELDGPVEIPSPFSSSSSIFAVDDNPTPIQVATSVLLTGAISIFLFRSLRRRAQRAKDTRLRSTGMQKDTKEEALDRLRELGAASIETGKPPSSPAQALLGAVAAGAIAVILYKFTTTIEAALNRQAISENYSVRQITVTIRTIVNGLCYLATCVFGVNSIGLFLYSVQLAFGSQTGKESPGMSSSKKNSTDQLSSTAASSESWPDSAAGEDAKQGTDTSSKD